MLDSCCPGNTTAVPAAPTIFRRPKGGNFPNGICLPSSCRSRTWQLVTCQENCQPSSSVPGGCEPAPCQPTCFPATSCVGFVCQPLCSCTAYHESSTGQSPHQPSCLESPGGQEQCYEVSPGQQSSCQEPVFVSEPLKAASGQSVCCDTTSCQPSCSEVTSCPESSCPPAGCAAIPCQPTCCQAGACHPISGEDQPCKSTYYQPICYIVKTSQSVPCMPVPRQPSTCMFSSCCVTSPCQPLYHCQAAPPISFICQPVANFQPPCSVKYSCKPASCGIALSGQSACGGPTFCNQSGYRSPPANPATSPATARQRLCTSSEVCGRLQVRSHPGARLWPSTNAACLLMSRPVQPHTVPWYWRGNLCSR